VFVVTTAVGVTIGLNGAAVSPVAPALAAGPTTTAPALTDTAPTATAPLVSDDGPAAPNGHGPHR
jgi:hypothetical protein